MLELLAVPQRGMPYVQIGFRIVLYISSLFSSESFYFLPMIQYMRWSYNPSCFLVVKMCFCDVSLRSRRMPKYSTFSLCGISCPFNVTVGQVYFNILHIFCFQNCCLYVKNRSRIYADQN